MSNNKEVQNINQNQNQNTNQNMQTNNYQNQNIKKTELLVDYRYICIKKDIFDVNMVDLNFNNINYNNQIELIYKSPTIILDGIFLKTPPISGNAITIIYKEKNANNITIKLLLNQKEHQHFIQIMKLLDEYLSSSINKYSNKIENDLDINNFISNYGNDSQYINNSSSNSSSNSNNNSNKLSVLKYEQVIKYNYYNSNNNFCIENNNIENNEKYQIYLKSYLDKNIINELEKKLNKKYIFTFNISNIYLSCNSLLPLIKCNRCEICA
jgi:hypothetical protein